jgi:Ca2+:H+ antiporter
MELGAPGTTGRMSLYHRLLHMPSGLPTHLRRRPSVGTTTTIGSQRGIRHSNSHSLVRGEGTARPVATQNNQQQQPSERPSHITLPPSPTAVRRLQRTGSTGLTVPAPLLPSGVGYTPLIETVSRAAKAAVEPISNSNAHGQGAANVAGLAQEPAHINLTTDEFTRAVAVATVSALRQEVAADAAGAARLRGPGAVSGLYDSTHLSSGAGGGGGHGGHEAPSWSRTVSASVLLSCTLLYAIIAGKSS